ncbi:MAG: hypothetical protein WBQ44_17305 [Rhodococcus sp. (in: high G+C Gram-positive bacteria)]
MSPHWAKAPAFTDDPARVDEIHAQTVRDKEAYLESNLAPVECRACGTRVLARKNSIRHTSVEWVGRPSDTCPVFREAGGSATQEGCPRMQDSLRHAVLEGILTVPDEAATSDAGLDA